MPKAKQKTEAEAVEFLRTKFAAQEYAVLAQVPDATGFGKVRTADALIVSLWPSRGLHLFGVEYKCSRHDWTRELKNPHKAESIGQYCHFWYMLAPKGIIKPEELPALWGLWEIDDHDRLLRTVTAPKKPDDQIKPLSYTFLAGILRAAENARINASAVSAARTQGFEDGKKRGAESAKQDVEFLRRQMDRVDEFEKASGLAIANGWNGARLGQEVRDVLAMLANPEKYQHDARQLLTRAFTLYRGALAVSKSLGITDEQIATLLRD